MATPERLWRVRVKICGVTRSEDARAAARLGADLLGLNFHRASPRRVDAGRALELCRVAREANPGIRIVGVFVEQGPEEIREIAERAELDLVQLHGDHDESVVEAFGTRAIRVLRIRRRLEPGCLARLGPSWGILVDARDPELWGGSGRSWDWSSLERAGSGGRRVLVAGGLAPDNVGALLSRVRPWGIDLASGLETEPGIKDHRRMINLFEEIERYGESSAAS